MQIAAFSNIGSAAEFGDGKVLSWCNSISAEDEEEIIMNSLSTGDFVENQLCWFESDHIDEAFAPRHMWRSVVIGKTAAETLNLQFNNNITGNVCFRVGYRHIWAHKQVLRKSLPYFDVMFQAHWLECEKERFEVDQFDYGTFYAFLNCLYTGKLQSVTYYEKLLELADYYGYKKLWRICKRKYEEQMESECRAHKSSDLVNYVEQQYQYVQYSRRILHSQILDVST